MIGQCYYVRADTWETENWREATSPARPADGERAARTEILSARCWTAGNVALVRPPVLGRGTTGGHIRTRVRKHEDSQMAHRFLVPISTVTAGPVRVSDQMNIKGFQTWRTTMARAPRRERERDGRVIPSTRCVQRITCKVSKWDYASL